MRKNHKTKVCSFHVIYILNNIFIITSFNIIYKTTNERKENKHIIGANPISSREIFFFCSQLLKQSNSTPTLPQLVLGVTRKLGGPNHPIPQHNKTPHQPTHILFHRANLYNTNSQHMNLENVLFELGKCIICLSK